MFRFMSVLVILLSVLSLGCDSQQEVSKEHVWSAQEDALKKAKEVEGEVLQAVQKQRQMIEQQQDGG